MFTTTYYLIQWSMIIMFTGIVGSIAFNDELNQLHDYIKSLRKESEVK